MARIRTIKPGFFASEDVSALPLRARLTWIGLWTHCDDRGRTKDNVKLIKAAVWPLDDVSLRDIEDDLGCLETAGRIVRYESGCQRYLAIVNWDDHQAINRPTPSKIPPPPGSVDTHVQLSEASRQEGKGREGKATRARASVSRRPAPHPFSPGAAYDDGTVACAACNLPLNNRAHQETAA